MFTRLFALPAALLLAACQTPGGHNSTTTDGSDTSTETSAITTGDPCPVGSLECPCTPGGACDEGLACELEICVEGCAMGSLGCGCTPGGGCDEGLMCGASDLCVEAVSETCGDGKVDEFEDCDDGSLNGDDKACTSKCKAAVCGDGLVGPGEACDGGDNCSASCNLTSCGNGTIDPGEECEPAGEEDVECTALCTDARKIIFVTSEHYKGGEIGGIAGGDAKCQALADAAGLGGEFKAWLATSKEDAPLVRFRWFDGSYVDVTGALLFDDPAFMHAPPTFTELGELSLDSEIDCGSTTFSAWSTTRGGPFVDEGHDEDCGGWTNPDETGAASRLYGGDLASNIQPTCWRVECSLAAPIICFEQ